MSNRIYSKNKRQEHDIGEAFYNGGSIILILLVILFVFDRWY